MALVRCAKCGIKPPGEGNFKRRYVMSVRPLGHPNSALICGVPSCSEIGLVWLEQSENDAYSEGQRIFDLQTNATKVKVEGLAYEPDKAKVPGFAKDEAVLRNLTKINWAYLDAKALGELEQRIAAVGRDRALIYYSDLVRGIRFSLTNVNDGRSYQIDVEDWQPLDRAILGDFLGQISSRSYERAGFMGSALAISQQEARPSERFFEWMFELGAMSDLSENTKLEFWTGQVTQAHEWYANH